MSTAPAGPRYLETLTPLRGIAALGVLLFHFDGVLVLMGFRPLVPATVTGLVHRGYLWVDFFFVLSGFVISHVYGDALAGRPPWAVVRGYVWSRFTRIYPLHLATLGMHVALLLVLGAVMPRAAERLAADIYAWAAVPVHLVLGHAMHLFPRQSWNTPSWSIAAEWWTYLAAVGLFPLVHGRGLRRGLLAIGAGVVATVILIALHPKHSLRITYDAGVLRCLFEFTIGVGVYQLFRAGAGARWLWRDGALAVAAFIALGLMHASVHDAWMAPAFGAVVLSAAGNQGWGRRLLTLRPLRWMGEVSYSFYMLQGLWLVLFAGALDHRKATRGTEVGWGAMLVWLAALLALNLGSAWLTHRSIEVKAREVLRRWAARAWGRATPVAAPPG